MTSLGLGERLAGPVSDEVASVRAAIARVLPLPVANDSPVTIPDDDEDEQAMLIYTIYTLYGFAPKLSRAWVLATLGGRHIGDLTNAELHGVIASLEAAKSDRGPTPANARPDVGTLAAA